MNKRRPLEERGFSVVLRPFAGCDYQAVSALAVSFMKTRLWWAARSRARIGVQYQDRVVEINRRTSVGELSRLLRATATINPPPQAVPLVQAVSQVTSVLPLPEKANLRGLMRAGLLGFSAGMAN